MDKEPRPSCGEENLDDDGDDATGKCVASGESVISLLPNPVFMSCPGCGGTVFSRAARCQHCRHVLTGRRRRGWQWLKLIGKLTLAIGLVGFVASLILVSGPLPRSMLIVAISVIIVGAAMIFVGARWARVKALRTFGYPH